MAGETSAAVPHSVLVQPTFMACAGRRCMVVEDAGDVARVVLPQGSTEPHPHVAAASCSLCDAALSSRASVDSSGAPAEELAADRQACFVDGRLVCDCCRSFLEPAGFVPRFVVCINPLCRRKWKQLSAKVLPLFCPPCRRHLEEGIPDWRELSERRLLEHMYHRWHAISLELAEAVGCPVPVVPMHASTVVGPGAEDARGSEPATRSHWLNLLDAFQHSFEQPPGVDDVRNWNSVHGRRKHFRGKILRCGRRFVCTLRATEELSEDLKTVKALPPEYRDFRILDWNNDYQDGQEVDFIAFPNPSVTERARVSRVVRLLTNLKTGHGEQHPDAPEEGNASECIQAAAESKFAAIDICSRDTSKEGPEVADFVEWSTNTVQEHLAPAQPSVRGVKPGSVGDTVGVANRNPLVISTTSAPQGGDNSSAPSVAAITNCAGFGEIGGQHKALGSVAAKPGRAGPFSSSTISAADNGSDGSVVRGSTGGTNGTAAASAVAYPKHVGPVAVAKPKAGSKREARVRNPKPKPGPLQSPLLVPAYGVGRCPSTPFPRSPYAAYFGD